VNAEYQIKYLDDLAEKNPCDLAWDMREAIRAGRDALRAQLELKCKLESGNLVEVVRCKNCVFENTCMCRAAKKMTVNLKTGKETWKTFMEDDGFCHCGKNR
jgi:hypothetical protein